MEGFSLQHSLKIATSCSSYFFLVQVVSSHWGWGVLYTVHLFAVQRASEQGQQSWKKWLEWFVATPLVCAKVIAFAMNQNLCACLHVCPTDKVLSSTLTVFIELLDDVSWLSSSLAYCLDAYCANSLLCWLPHCFDGLLNWFAALVRAGMHSSRKKNGAKSWSFWRRKKTLSLH